MLNTPASSLDLCYSPRLDQVKELREARCGGDEPMAGDDLAPLFIVGAPRSGTSLLYKLLCLHPRAAWISNWARRAPGVPAVVLLNRLAPRMPATRRRTWFGSDGASAYVYGRPRALVERLFPMPVEGEPVYRHCGIGTGD